MNIIEPLKPLAVPIDSITEDPHNARQHDKRNLDAIKKSFEIYGQRKPIVVNHDGIIEAGNGMYQAAKELGWTEIAAVTVIDNEDQAKGFGIMDNRSGELSEWDNPTLKDILEGLDANNYDLELTGFTMEEIENMMTAFPPDKPEKVETKNKCPECGYEW